MRLVGMTLAVASLVDTKALLAREGIAHSAGRDRLVVHPAETHGVVLMLAGEKR
jgi:hypothetical protein